jgi:hypothetical protein
MVRPAWRHSALTRRTCPFPALLPPCGARPGAHWWRLPSAGARPRLLGPPGRCRQCPEQPGAAAAMAGWACSAGEPAGRPLVPQSPGRKATLHNSSSSRADDLQFTSLVYSVPPLEIRFHSTRAPLGARGNAWVYICPQTTKSIYHLSDMHIGVANEDSTESMPYCNAKWPPEYHASYNTLSSPGILATAGNSSEFRYNDTLLLLKAGMATNKDKTETRPYLQAAGLPSHRTDGNTLTHSKPSNAWKQMTLVPTLRCEPLSPIQPNHS